MITIKFEMSGFQRLLLIFQRSRKALIAEKMDSIAQECLNIVKEMTPRGRTGKLRESIQLRKIGDMSWGITEGVQYGKWVRQGVHIPDIYPRTKKALWWKTAPHPVFKTRSHDNKANPYDVRAMKELETMFLPRKINDLAAAIRLSMEE